MTQRRSANALVIMPSLAARPQADGTIVLTRKLLDGTLAMAKHWDGETRLLLEPALGDSDNLDNIAVAPHGSGCAIRLATFDDASLLAQVRGATAVLASVHCRQNRVAEICAREKVACVYVAEYTLRTRLDIVRSETRNPMLWARRYWWEAGQELRQRRAIKLAAGLQCNGTPTHDAYRTLTPRPHLFFDSRSRQRDLIAPDVLERRLAALGSPAPSNAAERAPLRLLFSGRFLPWKGVQFLPSLVATLRDLGVAVTLDLCGDGVLTPALRADIERLRVSDRVRLRGTLDFARELTPLMQREVDLFVCPHIQGDPSSTFAEVFAAGVPITGFASEALTGMLRHAGAGWTSAMGDVKALAYTIAGLARDRGAIAAAARRARAFAAAHTFELSTARRMQHVRACASAVAGSLALQA